MELERRFCELRAPPDGRRILEGVAVRYGDVAKLPWGRERIRAGAFAPIGDVLANVMHDRARPIGRTGDRGGLSLDDGPDELALRLTLPRTRDADDVLILIRQRILRALSVEFQPLKETLDEGDVRVIERAELIGVGVVDRPAYPDSLVTARMALVRPRRRYAFL